MKKIAVLFFICFINVKAYSQEPTIPNDEPIYETKDIEVQPDFPGGLDDFYAFFDKKYKKPEVPDLIGKIFIAFTVEKDGTLTDIRTLKDIGFGSGIEAEKVLQLSPKWIPGKKDGKIVRVNYILPIGIHTD